MVIFVEYCGGDGFSADGSQAGHVPEGLGLHVRGPLLPGLARPVAVVMGYVLAEHPGKVAFAEDQDPVEQLAAEGPVDALADGVHPRQDATRQPTPQQLDSTGIHLYRSRLEAGVRSPRDGAAAGIRPALYQLV